MTVVKKATLGLLSVAVVSMVLSFMVFTRARSSQEGVTRYKDVYYVANVNTLEMVTAFYTFDDQMNMYVLVAYAYPHQSSLIQQTYVQAMQGKEQLGALIASSKKLERFEPGSDSLLARVQRDYLAYSNYASQVHSAVLSHNVSKAAYIQTIGNLNPSNDIMVALGKLQALTVKDSSGELGAVSSLQNSTKLVVITMVLADAVVLGVLFILFRRIFITPLLSLDRKLAALADGSEDINSELPEVSSDEFGQIARSFNGFRRRLMAAMGQVASSVKVLEVAASGLKEMSDDLADVSDDTATRAEQVSASADQIVSNAAAVSEATDEMRLAITEIASSASKAARVASSAVGVASNASDTVRRLGDSSNEVGEVVKTINDIAEQTNLLALNAAIEAARAGDAGRGFAVVASEVKDLAKDTAVATEDIAKKMEAIQSDTEQVIAAIAQISDVIREISDLQSSIASAVEEQSVTTNEIGRVAAEAAQGSSDAVNHIAEVVTTAHESKAKVESTRRSVSDLEKVALELSQLVSRFTSVPNSKSHSSEDPDDIFDSAGTKRSRTVRPRFGIPESLERVALRRNGR
jgi:methyl-accepting chemotaxis protein